MMKPNRAADFMPRPAHFVAWDVTKLRQKIVPEKKGTGKEKGGLSSLMVKPKRAANFKPRPAHFVAWDVTRLRQKIVPEKKGTEKQRSGPGR